MIPTIIIIAIIAVALFFAVRRISKKGGCDCASCDGACASCGQHMPTTTKK
ncbi:FeoB-associated Cys-rich membrane protein [Ruminococcaceae bacterium OttesenSCG-928-A16]|nr:FeoB-associated Cys-rich membrane protein [Ruminococcaceae bacterium OttesenSCG-928-A16]